MISPVPGTAARLRAPIAKGLNALHRWWTTPTVAWGGILLLGLMVMWRIWDTLDLAHGDTCSYYTGAATWRATGALKQPIQMVFSPLYTVFFGEVLRVFSDVYAATIIHRLIIMLASVAAVLGVMRNLLPKGLAWLIAAWWIVLPINWAGLYEVHFFGFFWAALGCWLAGAGRSVWWRGWGLAGLLCSGLLVRNELLLAAALFALCGVSFELYRLAKGQASIRLVAGNLLCFTAPSVLLVFLAALLFSGNPKVEDWRRIRAAFTERQRANMAQVYSFGYWQRHPESTNEPWSNEVCGALMARDFGSAKAKWAEALRKNPRALFAHVAWNFQLVPAGLELGLFNSYSGGHSPDFSDSGSVIPSSALMDKRASGTLLPRTGLGAVAAIWLAGLVCVARTRPKWRAAASRRLWTWLALASCLPSSLLAIATQRPRPAYILPLLLLCMAFTGVSLGAVARRCVGMNRGMAWTATGAGILALFVGYFMLGRPAPKRPMLADYRRLQPYSEIICHRGRVLCSNVAVVGELARYLVNIGRNRPDSRYLGRLEAGMAAGDSLETVLDRAGVTDLYLTGMELEKEEIRAWRETAESAGWRLVAKSDASDARWQLFTRDLVRKGNAPDALDFASDAR